MVTKGIYKHVFILGYYNALALDWPSQIDNDFIGWKTKYSINASVPNGLCVIKYVYSNGEEDRKIAVVYNGYTEVELYDPYAESEEDLKENVFEIVGFICDETPIESAVDMSGLGA